MKIIKRSQVAVMSLAVMVMIAGYINYRYDPEREQNLGQTVFVNGKDVYTYNLVDIYNETKETNSSSTTDTNKNTEADSNKADETIATFRSNRNNMYSEIESSYNKVITNSSSSSEQVRIYQDKLNSVINEKYLITLVEDLIKAKGIEDIVIVKTDDSVNVIVKSKDKLTAEKTAVIQKIIQDELKINANKITITQSK